MVTLEQIKSAAPKFFSRDSRRFFGDYRHEVYRGYLVAYCRRRYSSGQAEQVKVIYRFTGNDLMHEETLTGSLKDAKRFIDGLIERIEANSLKTVMASEPDWFENHGGEWFILRRYAVEVKNDGTFDLYFYTGKGVYGRGNFPSVAAMVEYIEAEKEFAHER